MTFWVDFLIGAALGAGFIALARCPGRLERAVLVGGLLPVPGATDPARAA